MFSLIEFHVCVFTEFLQKLRAEVPIWSHIVLPMQSQSREEIGIKSHVLPSKSLCQALTILSNVKKPISGKSEENYVTGNRQSKFIINSTESKYLILFTELTFISKKCTYI